MYHIKINTFALGCVIVRTISLSQLNKHKQLTWNISSLIVRSFHLDGHGRKLMKARTYLILRVSLQLTSKNITENTYEYFTCLQVVLRDFTCLQVVSMWLYLAEEEANSRPRRVSLMLLRFLATCCIVKLSSNSPQRILRIFTQERPNSTRVTWSATWQMDGWMNGGE